MENLISARVHPSDPGVYSGHATFTVVHNVCRGPVHSRRNIPSNIHVPGGMILFLTMFLIYSSETINLYLIY